MIQRLMDARKREQGGFTLIELLIVITILGILSGVVVFAVSGIGSKGEVESCKIDTRTIQTAQEAYRQVNKVYATSEAALVSGGVLASESTYHNVDTASAPYRITVQDPQCGVPNEAVGGSNY